MRQGQNPAKMGLKAYQPKKVGVALLSYIPNQEGFFANSLEVLKYQIASLHAATQEFDLLVFDNGSCTEVQEELQRLQAKGLIQFLFLSQVNMGKMGAINWILSAMPNEWICYSDGDMFFRPKWLERSLAIFEAFPAAGLVFAQPTLFDTLRGSGKAHLPLEADAQYRFSKCLIEPEAVHEYALGFGLNAEQEEGLKKTPVPVVEEAGSGTRAVVGGGHNQFLVRRETARKLVPLPTQFALSPIEDSAFNRHVDELGLLQLSTLEPYTFHVGNRLDGWTREQASLLGLPAVLGERMEQRERSAPASESGKKSRALRVLASLSRLKLFDRSLRRLYNLLFEYYAK